MRAFGVRGLTIYRADYRCSMRLLSAVTARSESSSSEIAKMILESRGRIHRSGNGRCIALARQGFQFPKTILIWFEAHPAAAGWMQATTVLQMIPARMKMPISTMKRTPVTATVRNTSSAVRKNMARLVYGRAPKGK